MVRLKHLYNLVYHSHRTLSLPNVQNSNVNVCRLNFIPIGEDYISPRDERVEGGIVEFNPGLGRGSTTLSLILVDNSIIEKMEYFRLNFAFEEDPNNPSPIVLSKCSPDEVLVAIQDNDGESDLVQRMNL